MSGEERRERMLNLLGNAKKPISGTALAEEFAVSRQVVVQDIALLRASGYDILSTNRGYMVQQKTVCKRIFKVRHTDEQMEEELNLFVDFGGMVEDEFVYHKIYDVVRVKIGLKSRRDVAKYMEQLKSGISKSLSDVTSGYHYHTITAESEQILDQIQEELEGKGFLAKMLEYEPKELQK